MGTQPLGVINTYVWLSILVFGCCRIVFSCCVHSGGVLVVLVPMKLSLWRIAIGRRTRRRGAGNAAPRLPVVLHPRACVKVVAGNVGLRASKRRTSGYEGGGESCETDFLQHVMYGS